MQLFLPSNSVKTVTLSEWVEVHSSEGEMRSLFLNLDRTLKYIHDQGYCIEIFHPSVIEVLNDSDKCILFKRLLQLPSDYAARKKMIQEDIFNSAYIQISFYLNCVDQIPPDFLRENFDSIAQFLPVDDVPYYRGVIVRNASVRFSEYNTQLGQREMEQLTKEVGELQGGEEKGSPFVKASFPIKKANDDNEAINRQIYQQINGYQDAAFIRMLAIPAVMLATVLLTAMLIWLYTFFS